MSASRDAFTHLLETLGEVGRRFAGDEWMIDDPTDVAEALRVIVHHLGSGVEITFEDDPAHPVFRQIVTPWRKSLGDNADAIYHDACIHPAGVYRVRGNTGGAVYVSFTVEAGTGDGSFPTGTVGVINDADFEVADDGSFEFVLGGPERPVAEGDQSGRPGPERAVAEGDQSGRPGPERAVAEGDQSGRPGPERAQGWLGLAPDASRLTVRHYWESTARPAAPPSPRLDLSVELVDGDVPAAPRAPTDESVAASIRRLATYVRGRTIDTILPPGQGDPPAFVSREPNVFPSPVKPGAHALAAADAAYSMAPFVLGPDEALVMTARWPECRCANVSLWNRQMQTFDYLRHRVSLNRAETVTEDDGSFRVVLAARDPGVPNWLDTEGRGFGLVFWRFMLPEGPIDTPRAEVVPLAEL